MIFVDNLSKSYNNLKVIDDLSLNVQEGEIFGILGRNGAGKTTFIECLVGLRKKDKGTVKIMGVSIDENQEQIKYIIGVQPQEASLFQRQTVLETLKLFSSFYSKSIDINNLMGELNLKDLEKKMVKSLSKGQKQRLLIAIAMIGDPRILILDEPTSGLDPQVRIMLWEFLKKLKKQGKTILLSTHYMEEAEELCDKVAILHNGKFVAVGTPKELIEKYTVEGKKRNLESAFIHLTGKDLRGGFD
ncbi:ABC transporter ATP-binding protein [Anoxybacteroides amylolyticum]|uniref:ABC transporter family protein n=1 Tax=Anoxybacteroides amylolyticum TaxID=294699 RepID=A0A160F7A1_9BACL|nr:ABC transporter ATP-binding protein [Anoxybacillus amylolyticus]ANB62152.1 ABC transporter family protein [Anoxybacillus amylolyticus]